jgi:hypothetical protein
MNDKIYYGDGTETTPTPKPSSLCGTANGHCCWFSGVECAYVEPVADGDFKWRCGLRADHGSWEAAYATSEYVENVKEKVNAVGNLGLDCGDWPSVGRKCNTCGEVG